MNSQRLLEWNTPSPVSADTAQELRLLAYRWVRQAAELITTRYNELGGSTGLRAHTTSKSSPVDPVTVVDTATESLIGSLIAAERPADGILGEEGSRQDGSSGVTWVVDPIDGTVNFLYGIAHYAVSIGAVVANTVVAGAVINVATGDVYSAARDNGATVDRQGTTLPLTVNDVSELGHALIGTGFAYSAERRRRQGAIVGALLPRIRDIRRHGAAALDLCYVAEGRQDAYYEHGINP